MAQTAPSKADLSDDHDLISSASLTKTSNSASEGTQRQSKRLTQSFPVLLSPTHVCPEHPASSSPKYSSPAEPARSSPRLTAQPVFPTDPTDFLTTLAAQERRVLELREELQKAESDLAGLKKHWAIFEANRKKSGIRHVEQLQPLPASRLLKTDSGGDIPTPLTVSTFEKLAAKPPRKPQQRVFSGSRHTRTLSLLTTAPGDGHKTYAEAFNNENCAAEPNPTTENNPSLSRSSTIPGSEINAGFGKAYKSLANRRSMPPPSADALVKTGRQIASDLKDGLWTFFEDIRQATVGDESINGTETRRPPAVRQRPTSENSPANGVPGKQRRSFEGSTWRPLDNHSTARRDHGHTENKSVQSFWKDFGVDTPGRQDAASRQPPPSDRAEEPKQQVREGLLLEVGDDWDEWESPVPHQRVSPKWNLDGATDKRNGNNDGADPLPWPELTKLTPSKLTITVSDMMRDWDSSGQGQSTSPSVLSEQVLTSLHM